MQSPSPIFSPNPNPNWVGPNPNAIWVGKCCCLKYSCSVVMQLVPRRGGGEVPEQPYQCTSCARTFASLSAMLQHQASKHRHAVAYLGRLAIG